MENEDKKDFSLIQRVVGMAGLVVIDMGTGSKETLSSPCPITSQLKNLFNLYYLDNMHLIKIKMKIIKSYIVVKIFLD